MVDWCRLMIIKEPLTLGRVLISQKKISLCIQNFSWELGIFIEKNLASLISRMNTDSSIKLHDGIRLQNKLFFFLQSAIYLLNSFWIHRLILIVIKSDLSLWLNMLLFNIKLILIFYIINVFNSLLNSILIWYLNMFNFHSRSFYLLLRMLFFRLISITIELNRFCIRNLFCWHWPYIRLFLAIYNRLIVLFNLIFN